jgi:hypothetical protein
MSRAEEALAVLDIQYTAFVASLPLAEKTKHPIPMDTRSWSQILVSTLTGVEGAARKKGPDFADGSDVKAANCWTAIDTPRFNGVAKAGTKAKNAGAIDSFDKMPHLYFVLWDASPTTKKQRCRVWVVRPQTDEEFRCLCTSWYKNGKIKSTNLQLHPPRNKDTNEFTNKCGNLTYPLFFCAERDEDGFKVLTHDPGTLKSGKCAKVEAAAHPKPKRTQQVTKK